MAATSLAPEALSQQYLSHRVATGTSSAHDAIELIDQLQMIGLISKQDELSAAAEFFQLFKTAWEPFVPGRNYSCVITTNGDFPPDLGFQLVVVYGSGNTACDRDAGIACREQQKQVWVNFDGSDFPIYGASVTFSNSQDAFLRLKDTAEVVAYEREKGARRVIRVGYDLFREIELLLSKGQPAENAAIATLEFHIAILRRILVQSGIWFAEILPVPAGYQFMACLTHDVDFVGIREHKFDTTMLGFLYRATVGSVVNALKGSGAWSKCMTNWRAVLSLPLVYLGLKEDFWLEFDRFAEIEKDLGSTYFFIPFRKRPGMLGSRPAPKRRAAKYDFLQMRDQVNVLASRGCEIGLHGIDAWQSSDMAKRERARICEATGQVEVGVRMHWLYFAEGSPKALEQGNLSYDSTFGYNDAIGFRAGTAQVFHFFQSDALLELPLIMQDTALFYPGRMGLSDETAMERCRQIFEHAAKWGGVVTVNWHTRSLSPERLWGDFYKQCLKEMQQFRVLFGTAGEAVQWFRARRSINFEEVAVRREGARLQMSSPPTPAKFPFLVRVYHLSEKVIQDCATPASPGFHDIHWDGKADFSIAHHEHVGV
jgi:hypothetical protein